MEVNSNGSGGPEETSGPSLQFEHVVCHWSDSAMEDTLFDVSLLTSEAMKFYAYRGMPFFLQINLTVNKPQVVAVVGRVGSGKSSLIQAVLGEINKSSGKVLVNGQVSYTSQNPFVFSGTIRENIVFGEPMDHQRYDSVTLLSQMSQIIHFEKMGMDPDQ